VASVILFNRYTCSLICMYVYICVCVRACVCKNTLNFSVGMAVKFSDSGLMHYHHHHPCYHLYTGYVQLYT
jgi:hypothetical protein